MPAPRSIAVVGGGIIGTATARELHRRFPDSRVVLFEKEHRVAGHQTGHNSGVVHAGLYYEPGGLKARLTRRGVDLLREFAEANDVPYEACGKVVVATDELERERLDDIHRRAKANGVPGVRLVDRAELREIEPRVEGLAAVHSPETAIIDYGRVTAALARDFAANGGELRMSTEVERIVDDGATVIVETNRGGDRFDAAVVCGGLQSDRIARASGAERDPAIVPFFGQYLLLEERFNGATNGLVYPVPDPAYPFLGVHITRRVDGNVMIGPNAFLSFAREGYRDWSLNPKDLLAVAANPGFWRFAGKNIASAFEEFGGVLSTKRFLSGAARFVPELADAKVTRLTRGVRAQAMNSDGTLVDDFVIQRSGRSIFVRNAPSPGATSSLAIAEHLADHLSEELSLGSGR
ncbi:L-2-hydroxyglutarate oxidase [Gulosibacter sp. 10]|uniref:L-2-hydroxyglutarate oxidase n=1 Tax=Gulosibacter sp. 10 TaxID=1255570 RepID=UPI00097E9C65|nr:L-2-hydroxyglutarate oxidase [Gulosibacter sp. 10]SJM71064.1 L-2-hydroxyglutarate oxidase [Gulosibacter sp. 10]